MELLFVFIISLLLAILNQLHVIIQWFARPANTYFTGIAHYFRDYFLYTDIIAQGASGNLWTAAHFTNEPMAKTWIYWFNALLGFLGNLVGLSPFGTYNVSLFLLVIALCLLWYYVTKIIYPTNKSLRLTSWIMILTASSFAQNGNLLWQFWFSPAPAFNRLGGVPHQVFQTIVYIALAIVFSRFVPMKLPHGIRNLESGIRVKTFLSSAMIHDSIFMILLTILASTANPIQMALFLCAAAITTTRKNIVAFSVLAILGVTGAWITNRAFDLPVLAASKQWENAQFVSVSLWQFILSMGPIALLLPFGVKPFLKEKTPLRLLLFSYSALSILMFFSPIPKLLGTTSVRWLFPASYAILGILAAEGMFTIPKKYLLIIGYVLLTVPSLAIQINSRANTSELNHVPMAVIDALTSLKNSARGGVVLTDPSLPYDVLVPTFTGLPSFTGHPIHTLYPGVKESLRERFFSGAMTEDEKKKFLKDHRIRYIITKENGSIKISTHE